MVSWLDAQVVVTGLALGPQVMLTTTATFYFGDPSSPRWLGLHSLLVPSIKDVSAEHIHCPPSWEPSVPSLCPGGA